MANKRFRFTIRSFMILVAVLAVPLALFPLWALVLLLSLAALLIPTFVAVTFSRWLLARERRRLASISFWGLAIVVNTLYAACCIIPEFVLLVILTFGWLLVCLPMMIGFGSAWTVLSTREGAIRRRSPILVKACVVAMAMWPALTLGTLWPLRVAFLVSRPSLERLADLVAAGQPVELPQRARVFQVVRIDVDPLGTVVLTMGASSLVRIRSGDAANFRGAPFGTELIVNLGGGWSYREND